MANSAVVSLLFPGRYTNGVLGCCSCLGPVGLSVVLEKQSLLFFRRAAAGFFDAVKSNVACCGYHCLSPVRFFAVRF